MAVAHDAPTPRLLFEPVPMGRRLRVVRELDKVIWLFRTPKTDGTGAIAQRMALRFALLGDSRKSIARRFGYAERHASDLVSGRAWGEYTQPIRDWLEPFGMSFDMGCGRERRLASLTAAQTDLLRQCAEAIAWPGRLGAARLDELQHKAYILGLGWLEDDGA